MGKEREEKGNKKGDKKLVSPAQKTSKVLLGTRAGGEGEELEKRPSPNIGQRWVKIWV